MSEENYMRIIDLRGKKLTRAEMLEAMPRAEMGTNEATDLVQPILDDVKARGAAALRDFAEKFDHIRPETTMFGDVNEKVGTIAAEVGRTPQAWNANVFSMIRALSENVIVPIAGLVITYVLCYELISMVTEKNNMHDIDTFLFFKWVFKAFVAVYLVTHTFDITMAVFDMAQHVVSGASGVIGGNTNIDVAAALGSMQDGLEAMEIPELLLLVMETSLVSLCMKIMSVLITVILYGRMIEIYLYCSVSPIPFATMTNREWGQIGNNYLKALFAIGFQGFLIMVCVGIYAVLVNSMIIADNLHSAIFSLAAYTVILCFSLFKSGALAKSIFNAH